MIWMLHRVQPRLFWAAILGGILIATGRVQANGAGEPTGTGTGTTGAVAAGTTAGSGHASGGERSSGPVEVSRGPQPAVVTAGREARVQPVARERVEGGNQPGARGSEAVADARRAAVGVDAGRYVVRNGNSWTDPAGGVQPQRYYGSRNNNRQNFYRRRSPGYPYIYQYYGGYYPIYVDVPVIGNYGDAGPDASASYDDGAQAAAADPNSAVGPVIAPSTVNVSPPPDNGQTAADGAGNAGASPDAAQAGNHSPNPSLGPDSLVEAVQAELTRRGYFQGKVDAMFRADTEAALRKFQQDNYLAPTGHLNEPTLHALNLD